MAELFDKINNDIKQAMKEKDQEKLSVLRMMKSKILYVNARGDQIPDPEIIKILAKYSKELVESAEEAKKVGRSDDAAKSENELKIVQEYLPKQLSDNEIKKAVEDAIKELNASSVKDMGNVMKAVLAKYPGVDGKIVNRLVREALT
ncbi:hypothetical protein A3J90_03760 [candidate division WOR-1 bacterium RIFOXYC2_FULL_37_10]|uniref:Glutamyl-tRNA amidotransferase n=1 Tax=candidate division WOR-1 bacterium RIFOXYB2_FULL_37_13 TaxID=1802579 RepID=A0A1F4SXA6_UNCSA|nr:MAG: hypothetical protein A2246_06010 [candidate division WOR-1 bacterium RIFOXYA2_FULL_37_7]OGC25047.1 MAG: hypothetical protein A2310_00050 [candidate division WOR-1 bacterium RIFOXYB2_FULL_37_13]OGC35307.1 MAG: hypothetical protein A3J90_03760 [candidate division WOR-1 bacterium RIFOXYC2_FULL_37_10]